MNISIYLFYGYLYILFFLSIYKMGISIYLFYGYLYVLFLYRFIK